MSSPNRSWTLTVAYEDGVATISDGNGGDGTETVFRGESDQVTYQPGTGVGSVNSFAATSSYPTDKITITQRTSGNNLIVTDTNNLLAADPAASISYCITFTDSNGTRRTTDPQLINRPTVSS